MIYQMQNRFSDYITEDLTLAFLIKLDCNLFSFRILISCYKFVFINTVKLHGRTRIIDSQSVWY